MVPTTLGAISVNLARIRQYFVYLYISLDLQSQMLCTSLYPQFGFDGVRLLFYVIHCFFPLRPPYFTVDGGARPCYVLAGVVSSHT